MAFVFSYLEQILCNIVMSSLTKFTRKKVFRHITNVSFQVSIDREKFQQISLHDVSSLHDKAKLTTNLLDRDGEK